MTDFQKRIHKALAKGPLSTYDLATILWPQDTCSSAWRHSPGGGPPAWVRTLGKAVNKDCYVTWNVKYERMVRLA